jgi:hypothetical protein
MLFQGLQWLVSFLLFLINSLLNNRIEENNGIQILIMSGFISSSSTLDYFTTA